MIMRDIEVYESYVEVQFYYIHTVCPQKARYRKTCVS